MIYGVHLPGVCTTKVDGVDQACGADHWIGTSQSVSVLAPLRGANASWPTTAPSGSAAAVPRPYRWSQSWCARAWSASGAISSKPT